MGTYDLLGDWTNYDCDCGKTHVVPEDFWQGHEYLVCPCGKLTWCVRYTVINGELETVFEIYDARDVAQEIANHWAKNWSN